MKTEEGQSCGSWARAVLITVVAVSLGACSSGGPSVGRVGRRLTGAGVVVFAHRSLSVGPHGLITGKLEVRDASQPGASAQLTLSSHASVTGDIAADIVHVASKAAVTGAVKGNTLDVHQNALLSSAPITPLSLPLPDLTPQMPPVQPGTESFTVAAQTTESLVAGAYGQVRLLGGSRATSTVLRLSGGLYQLKELELGDYSRVECVAACDIRIQGRLQTGDRTFIGPVASSGLVARDVAVFAAASNAPAAFGEEGSFVGRLVAPNGELSFCAKADVHGLLIGRTVAIGPQATLVAEDALPPPAPDAGLPVDSAASPDQAVTTPDAPRPDAAPPIDSALPDSPQPDSPRPDAAPPDSMPPDLATTPDAPCGTIVGPAGGTVTSADGRATLEIPAGALGAAACLRLIPAGSAPAGYLDTAYDLLPAATSFAQAATLRIKYDLGQLGGAVEANLTLGTALAGAWHAVPFSTVSLTLHEVRGDLATSGTFGAMVSVCGDGLITGNEQCEGTDLNSQSCESIGFPGGGTLGCKLDCSFDSSLCCMPVTCVSQGKDCGSIGDGCGDTLECGTCAAPQSCGGGGTPNVCGCTPTSCAALGKNCDSFPDGCGGTLACGSCTPPQTCGGGGTPGTCGCTPTSCAAQGKNCGSIPDSCGGTLACGFCAPPESCGGGGQMNVCGCTPSSCETQGKDCGAIDDGCGMTLSCGTCTPPETCGGSGVPNQCGCTPTTCEAAGKNCGTIADGCGGTLECGSCAAPLTCGGGGTPNLCGCTPTTCVALGVTCGTAPDGCGGTLECGLCTPPDTCGGAGIQGQCGCTPTTCAAEGKNCGTIPDGCIGTLDCGACPAGQICGWGGAPNVCGNIPPDPSTVAPPLEQGVATTIDKGTAFLYTGPNPIQAGVAPGTIKAYRAGVIRGRVLDVQGSPRPGVSITVLDHPELGSTRSRIDGWFDLVVNGGGDLVVKYELAGHLPVQRRVQVGWLEWAHAGDVVMTPLDGQVTTIASMAPSMQVAQGSTVTDSDGTRRATLLFPAGTAATMRLPDGTTQPLPTLAFRATEFTVGALGQARMPAELPANVAYTYAVELGADEAIAAGATRVELSSPAIKYVENFLGMPVGELVPLGYYDREQSKWIPAPSGRVVEILSVTSGNADLDIDGSGLPADAAALAALGVSDEERSRLATLYSAGQSLWRMPIGHFTAYDANWPWDGSGSPPQSPPAAELAPGPPPGICPTEGCTIGAQTQTLGEQLSLVGTPLTLNYQSGRVPGRVNTNLRIYVLGADVPAGLKRVELTVTVAGRAFSSIHAPAPYQSHAFTWDGLDAWGRAVQGQTSARIEMFYVFDRHYCSAQTFGGTCGAPLGTSRAEFKYRFYAYESIGHLNVKVEDLGGWSVDPLHSYDPGAGILYKGDGSIERFGGSRTGALWAVRQDDSRLGAGPLAIDSDGTLYVYYLQNAYYWQCPPRITKTTRDGTTTVVAGQDCCGGGCSWGSMTEGIPATQASIGGVAGLAVDRQGNLYLAGNNRVRMVRASDGLIITVAGNGTAGFSGDGGQATQSQLNNPGAVAVDEDGNLFIADEMNNRVRKVGTDGIISTVAGNGAYCDISGDGVPALSAGICRPSDVALDRAGNLYIAGYFFGIRVVRPDGILTRILGPGATQVPEDGSRVPALTSNIGPTSVASDGAGNVWAATTGWPGGRLFRIGSDGMIEKIAGSQSHSAPPGYAARGVPATSVQLSCLRIAIDPAGVPHCTLGNDAYAGGWLVYKVLPPFPGFFGGEVDIASEDGQELYHFDPAGRHLSTRSTMTGATLWSFGRDGQQRLTSITDRDGRVTAVERSPSGAPTAIVGPDGQRTALGLDGNGWLESVTNPANEAVALHHEANGLLTSKTDARGKTTSFVYDSAGRLLTDSDDAQGSLSFSLSAIDPKNYTVSETTGESRVTTYKVEQKGSNSFTLTNTFPGGLVNTAQTGSDARTTVTFADGSSSTEASGADPRWALQSPIPSNATLKLPSGLTRTSSMTRTASLSDPLNLLSLTQQTDTVTVNGRTGTTVYDAASRRYTTTSPAGRVTRTDIDAKGRVVRREAPGLAPVTYSYDSAGRLLTVTQGTGPTARITTYAYQPNGWMASITDPLSRVTSFEQDLAGRTTKQTLPGNRDVLFSYDANGNLTALTPPGRTAHLFGYTPVNLEESYTPPDVGFGSTTTSYEYNKDRQLKKVTRPDGLTIDYAFDAAGRLSTVTTPTGVSTYVYNAATGKITSIAAPGGVNLSYAWDGSFLKDTTWSGPVAGTISRSYSTDFEVSSLTVAGTNVTFTRDNDRLLTGAGALILTRDSTTSLITSTTLGTVTTALTYSGFGELASRSASAGSTALYSTSFTRDALGRVTQLGETIEGVSSSTVFDYDTAGRLWKVTVDGALAAEYLYDPNGNRLSVSNDLGLSISATYDAQDRLLTYGSTSYTYTKNGELLTKTDASGTTTFSYDVLGNLRSVVLADGRTIEYVIDGQNRRVGKRVNGTLVQGFLWKDKLGIVAELDGTGGIASQFVYGESVNVPEYMIKGGATYRILTDHLGSPRLIVDASTGTIAQRMDYDEWGRVLLDTNPGFQPFGFAGGLYDRDTKLVRFMLRDYDAATGSWTNKDPIEFAGGEKNLYQYASGDPINRTDPLGMGFPSGQCIKQIASGCERGCKWPCKPLCFTVCFIIATADEAWGSGGYCKPKKTERQECYDYCTEGLAIGFLTFDEYVDCIRKCATGTPPGVVH